jgi:hypothetical protein
LGVRTIRETSPTRVSCARQALHGELKNKTMANKTVLKILQNYYFKTLSQNSNLNAGAATSPTICNVFAHEQHWSRTQHAQRVLAWGSAHHRDLHRTSIGHSLRITHEHRCRHTACIVHPSIGKSHGDIGMRGRCYPQEAWALGVHSQRSAVLGRISRHITTCPNCRNRARPAVTIESGTGCPGVGRSARGTIEYPGLPRWGKG